MKITKQKFLSTKLFIVFVLVFIINTKSAFCISSNTYLSNNESIENIVSEPQFSKSAGFYNESFMLTLSNKDGHKIFYTLDGSDPRASTNAVEYVNEINIYDNTNEPNELASIEDICLIPYTPPQFNIDKGMVVRAVSKDANGNFSNVVTNNYFINKTKSYYYDLNVIAITTDKENLFDPDYGIYMVGNQYYEWKNSYQFDSKLTILSNLNPTNYNSQGAEWERPCNIQVFKNGNLDYNENVGIRISGSYSTHTPQKSFTLFARSEYGNNKMNYDFFNRKVTDVNNSLINEFSKVTLKNGGTDNIKAFFRDSLNQSFANNLNFAKQAKADYVVFINGEFWGYYILSEKIDNHYIESHFNIDKDDITIIEAYSEYEGSGEIYNKWNTFWNWVQKADIKDEENYKYVKDVVDISSFIDFIAFQNYIANYDCLVQPNNWKIWRTNNIDVTNKYADGKWRFLTFDTDYSTDFNFFCHYSVNYLEEMDRTWSFASITSLFCKLLDNPAFKHEFIERSKQIYKTNFSSSIVSPRINDYEKRLINVVNDTNDRYNKKVDFSDEVNKIRLFYDRRPMYVLEQLKYLKENNQFYYKTVTVQTPSGDPNSSSINVLSYESVVMPMSEHDYLLFKIKQFNWKLIIGLLALLYICLFAKKSYEKHYK